MRTRIRGHAALVLGLVALLSSWVMPLAASRPAASSLTVELAAAKPLEGTEDLAYALGVGRLPDPQLVSAAAESGDLTITAQLSPEEMIPVVMPTQFDAGSSATSYVFRGRNSTDNLRALMCLTSAIYYEAANEPDDGQRAVAQVVLNRVRHPAWPNTVCDVVYQGTERWGTLCQFTFACDGAMARTPMAATWARARRVAQAALAGYVFAPAGLATNYHTLAVSPSWGKSLTPTGVFGAHIFYRLPGGVGEARAFHSSYRGYEPYPGPRTKIGPPPGPALPPTSIAAATPLPLPQTLAPGTLPPLLSGTPKQPESAPQVAAIAPAKRVADDKRYVPGTLPDSDILPQYRGSGEWIGK